MVLGITMGGWMNEWMHAWVNERVNGWINEWSDEWLDCAKWTEQMNEWVKVWMNEWSDESAIPYKLHEPCGASKSHLSGNFSKFNLILTNFNFNFSDYSKRIR